MPMRSLVVDKHTIQGNKTEVICAMGLNMKTSAHIPSVEATVTIPIFDAGGKVLVQEIIVLVGDASGADDSNKFTLQVKKIIKNENVFIVETILMLMFIAPRSISYAILATPKTLLKS